MNLKRKIILDTFATGLLLSPLGYMHSQANAEV